MVLPAPACHDWAMGEHVGRVLVIAIVVVVGFSVLGWLLKALWWMAVIAGGIVLAALVLGKMSKQ